MQKVNTIRPNVFCFENTSWREVNAPVADPLSLS